MYSRTISLMSYVAGTLVVAYLALVVVTVTLAAVQTNLSMEVHETEQDIARFESRYYDMIAVIDRTDPSSKGLVKPARITYAAETEAPAVTLR